MRFSQRIGAAPAQKLAQRESVDSELKAGLWSLVSLFYWDSFEGRDEFTYRSDEVKGSNLQPLIIALWFHFFKVPVDTIDRHWEACLARIRKYFFEAQWFQIYDFIEFLADHGLSSVKNEFISACNSLLERENAAYRFIGGAISEITSQEEIDEVESAIAAGTPLGGVGTHLKTALAMLSSRVAPDYRNSIKESISAVEATAKRLAGQSSSTLGDILKGLERQKKLHPALRNALSSLYGYSSDSQGIRHALMDEPNLTKADAKFMLVCCSAFVNYVIEMLEVS